MPLENVRKALKIAKEPLSLETPIGDEGDSNLGDLIEDQKTILPIDAAIQSNLREAQADPGRSGPSSLINLDRSDGADGIGLLVDARR